MDQELSKSMVVRYGQVIRIHLQSDVQNYKGLLLGKGFTDKNIHLQHYSNFYTLSNYRDALFQILPRGSFEIHDEKLKRGHHNNEDSLDQRMKAEADQYHLTLQNRLDEEVVFGAEVIFRHVDSDEYLQGSYECSDFATDAFKLQLADLLSSLVIFKLIPYQSFQQEGHPIYIDEPIIIQHEKSKCKVDFVNGKRVFIDEEINYRFSDKEVGIDMDAYDQFKPVIRKPPKETKRYEAVINHGGEIFWVLKLHETYEQTKEKIKIKPYDLCVFQYTENKGYLSVDQISNQLILKDMKEHETIGIPLDSVWELQPANTKSEDEFRVHDNSQMNRIRNQTMIPSMGESMHRGRASLIQGQYHQRFQDYISKQEASDQFILRHYLSGKVLTTKPKKHGVQEGLLNVQDDEKNFQQCFTLTNAKKGFEELTQNTYVKVINESQELQIHYQSVHLRSKPLRRDSSFQNNDMFYKKLNEEDLDYKKHTLLFANKKSLHAFQIFKLNDELRKDMFMITSSHEQLLQFADILKLSIKEAEQKFNDKALAKIQDVFRSLLAYVMGLKDKQNAEKSENLPIKNRQRYMKDLQMVEICMDIIYFLSFRSGMDKLFKNWKTERDRVQSIYRLSHILIEKITKNNPQTKLHVSQWLELFLQQATSIDDVSVQGALNELLDDNYQAISKFITPRSLSKLYDKMVARNPHDKYLKILSSICMCNGKSIIKNQNNVLQFFYQNIQPEFKFQFRVENKRVEVLCHLGKKDLKWRTLSRFYEDSGIADDYQSWQYFQSYFELLGDVCANRNKLAKKYVEENFPLPILCSLIEDPESIKTTAIQAFLKLVHMAYIDCQYYTPIRRIARVREWYTIETKNDILRTHAEEHLKPENNDLKRIMEFIEKFLTEFQYFDVRKRTYNQNLFTILQVLKTTLMLGFWKSITNLQSLLPNLLKICSCNRDLEEDMKPHKQAIESDKITELQLKYLYENSKKNITKMNLENIQVMNCKMLACEIMDIIIDMETNVRVSKSTQIFKQLISSIEEDENKTQRRFNQLDPTTPSQNYKKQVKNLHSLQEEHKQKKKNSLLYQFLDGGKSNNEGPLSDEMAFIVQQQQKLDQVDSVRSVDRWIEIFKDLIQQRDLFCKVDPNQFSIEVLFAEQTLYENTKMLQFALSLLSRIYGQRRELFANFEKILIVANGFTYQLSLESRVTRAKLAILSDNNILELTYDKQKDYQVWVFRDSNDPKETGIIQDLYYLTLCLKNSEVKRSQVKINFEDLQPENGLIEMLTERQQNNRLHQSLLRCQDLHEHIINFIKLAANVKWDNQLLIKLLGACYTFLTMIIWNHHENKQDLLPKLPILQTHLHYNVGCIDFVRELYANNKVLLLSEYHVQTFLQKVVHLCNQELTSSYYKSKLFDALRVLVVFENKPIKNNQIATMAQLQSKQYQHLMFNLQEEGRRQTMQSSFIETRRPQENAGSILQRNMPLWNPMAFSLLIEQYEQAYDEALKSESTPDPYLLISPELTFMFTYFEVFSLLIEDNNEINAGKCKNMHPYKNLIQILNESGRCWPLKRYVRAYVNRLYYAQPEYEGVSQILIEHDFNNIISDLSAILDIKIQESNLINIKIRHPVRYSYLYSYIYLTLVETLITLSMIINRNGFLDDLEDQLVSNFAAQKFKVHLQLLEMGTLLNQIKRVWRDNKDISQFARVLLTTFKGIYRTFDLALLVTREALLQSVALKCVNENTVVTSYSLLNGEVQDSEVILATESTCDPVDQLNPNLTKLVENNPDYDPNRQSINEFLSKDSNQQLLKDRLINSIFDGSDEYLKLVFPQNAPNKFQQKIRNIYIKKDALQENINEQLNNEHRQLLNSISMKSKFLQFLDEEFYQVCEKLNRINEESSKIYKVPFPVITLKEFVQNIIYLNIHDPDCFKDELRVFFLKVLARIITEKNLNNKEKQLSIDHWTPEFWSDYKSQIEAAQQFLDECGASELICQLLKNKGLEQRITLTNELLIFGVAFLLGGNTTCQMSLLSKLKEDQHNIILINYTTMIKKIGRVVYNNFKIRKVRSKFHHSISYEIIDNFDYFDVKTESMERRDPLELDPKEQVFSKNCLNIMCRSFRFLQLMCENNNVDFKNYIRVQTDTEGNIKLNTMNLIEFTTCQLRIFLKILSKRIIFMPNFLIDFIIEVIQLPCQENQLTLCRSTFFEDACYLSQFFTSQEHIIMRDLQDDIPNLQELYNKILIAVMSVLEGNDERIYEDLQHKLEPRFLVYFIEQNLEILKVKDAKHMVELLGYQESMFGEQIQKILNVLFIKQKIRHLLPGESKWLEDLDSLIQISELEDILAPLEKKIRTIEIVYQEKNQVIYFPSHPLFEQLSDDTKNKIMFTIKRETQREKILGLLEIKDIIFDEIEHNYSLDQQLVPVTHKSLSVLHMISAGLSVMVNVLMLYFYNISIKNKRANFFAEFEEEIILNMTQILQMFASVVYLIFFLVNRAPLCLKMIYGGQHQIPKIEVKLSQVDIQLKLSYGLEDFTIKLLKKDPIIFIKQALINVQNISVFTSLWTYYHGGPYAIYATKKLYFWFYTAYHLAIIEDEFIVVSTYVLCSVLGVFYKNYFFSLHLFFLFSRISLLNNVFQAISYNAKQLIVVAQLGVLFVYVFSFTSFSSYVDDIYEEDIPEEHCDTVIKCMITLITSEVIGKGMEKWDPIKFLYDTVYFVFFALLFTNIVSGIMIDTFAELRDQRQKIEDDKKNLCFICGVDRVTLEKNKEEEFHDHILQRHYLWNYIFYIYVLKMKDSTEYTGLEYAISDMISKEDISWFPIKQSDNSLAENIEILSKRIDNLEINMTSRQLDLAQTLQSLLLKNQSDEEKPK